MSWGCICESTPLLLVPSWTACIRESHLDLFCSCSLQPSFFSVLSKKKHLITVAACQTSSVQKVTPPAPAHNLAQHIVKEHGILLMAEHQPALAIALSRNNHLVVWNFWTKHWCGYFLAKLDPQMLVSCSISTRIDHPFLYILILTHAIIYQTLIHLTSNYHGRKRSYSYNPCEHGELIYI